MGLYRALFEEWPFSARDLSARIAEIRSTEPRPGGNPRQVPTWLRRVVLRGLAPEPDARHESMTALVHALGRDKRSRRRQRWFTVGASAVIGAAVASLVLLTPPALTAEDEARIETLVNESRAAAEAKHYVYPDPEDTRASALAKIMQLEASEVAGAQEQAQELRVEFAAALVELADDFAARPGGEAFASDYYAAAVLLDPAREDARARTNLTPGELATLRRRAEEGTFTPRELANRTQARHARAARGRRRDP